MQRGFYFTSIRRITAACFRIIRAANFNDLTIIILDHIRAGNVVSVHQAHFPARSQPENIPNLPEIVSKIRQQGIRCEVIYLAAQTNTLIRRFSETRRRHPLTDANRPLDEAIKQEHILLEPLISHADLCVDTTHTTPHELRDLIKARLGGNQRRVSVLFESFAFKKGVPRGVDFVFDVRSLPNPHWKVELRPLSGLDPDVVAFLEEFDQTHEMQADLIQFLERWIPRFQKDGRSYLTIAIGCTGGQHRSVYVTDRLFNHFQSKGYQALSRHRELP